LALVNGTLSTQNLAQLPLLDSSFLICVINIPEALHWGSLRAGAELEELGQLGLLKLL
jgi:predicted nucleic acid-binding protein